ncbi:HalOD1 output domain-containing protein [Halosimplex sp. TS25]|uniref:HalOD1 output domain-containing protein n=1 Tax=Halosimplex rarum TaxID=3396619 RepID=UPI0039EA0644
MGEMLSTKVTRQIAAREGVDPLHLDEPLYDVIDVGALETMVESAGDRDGGTLEVTFTYYGYEVVVDETGEVTVAPTATAGNPGDESANRTAAGK